MHLLPLLTLAPFVSAQYFSAGWQPGQPIHATHDAAAPAYTPGAEAPPLVDKAAQPKSLSELFSINTLLTLPPVASVFESFGVNITERVALNKVIPWDERIPLITDENYQDLIVNEPLIEEEKERVWIVVISVTAAKQDGISKYLDQIFDSAYNTTLEKDDLPNVRWGRINYLDVTYLTTKWNVWQAPYLMIITDRGQSLRFYQPHAIRLRDYAVRDFLLNEHWKNTPKWESRYAPGGDREWIMHFFATYLAKIYNIVVIIPRWLLFVLTGAVGSVILNILHRPSKKQAARNAPAKPPTTSTQPTTDKPAASVPAPTPAPAPAPAPPSEAKVKSEPVDNKAAAATTITPARAATPKRNGRKGKGKKQ
ncbi:hypothetical protein P691DRAFT_701799 [Macrolepiota fuliginosa MF-IS2]|uniref:Thioredoxin-like fold domain-containing protein n=1 Tax=Macrolepiota fuliginosa MF-IS2 TaxID=1400762 RepID=A0A9P6C5U5_9AGAR|nr:hypothetical protein P691DRAFT_701799 [Macrolepiota fuliginosa MF-IS2]